jgi:S-DNA-T family DNA segregation ATPase FtsK/SpoIIIE
MASTSNPRPANNSLDTGSAMGDTVIVIVVALAKAVAVLAWWSVLFPMISIPTLASIWLGLVCGPVFGLLLAAVSGLGLAAWSQLSPHRFTGG